MTIALWIVAGLLGVIAIASALSKLTKKPELIAQLTGLGVPEKRIPILGLLEIAGALGLLAGIWIPALGIAAAAGLTLYFLGAVIAHLRHGDGAKEFAPAAVLLGLSIATVILEILR
jgi:uncharacterized membrane protein